MARKKPQIFTNADEMADFIYDKMNNDVKFGTQLALGKPNFILNAIYKRALKDPNVKLQVLTALTPLPPKWGSDLERRMLEPITKRVWGECELLQYALDVRDGKLPENVMVSEFFYKAGAFMSNTHMQRNYISTNYTHAARDIVDNGMNVAGALIASKTLNGSLKYSVSSNADTAMDAIDLMRAREVKGSKMPTLAVAEINNNLPFMYGDAVVDPTIMDAVLEGVDFQKKLFSVPKEAINTQDFMIGINASSLLPDDSTLQIGIGSIGDAVAHGLITRNSNNEDYKALIEDTKLYEKSKDLIDNWGGMDPFKKGIYGSSEMMVDSFFDLYKSGVMKRRVFDDIDIQRLVSAGLTPNYKVSAKLIPALLDAKAISTEMTEEDFNKLQFFGILRDDLTFKDGKIVDGKKSFSCDFSKAKSVKDINEKCLGKVLKNGFWMHGGFFIGPQKFYDSLNNLSEEERGLINMTSVLNVNQLYGNNPYSSEDLKVLQRKNARFINTGLMVTLSGAVVSDGLENGKVISGVGGQYNFVSQAHALDDARGGMIIRSTRGSGSDIKSNVVFNYGHCTVPRHLRDVVITEYGLADLRGKSDETIMIEMIKIADSRFQDQLLKEAKDSGKLSADYELPKEYRNNLPEVLEARIKPYKDKGLFPTFPFGTDFTDQEIVLGRSLRGVKAALNESKLPTLGKILGKFIIPTVPAKAKPYLERMGLDNPKDFKEKFARNVVLTALKIDGSI